MSKVMFTLVTLCALPVSFLPMAARPANLSVLFAVMHNPVEFRVSQTPNHTLAGLQIPLPWGKPGNGSGIFSRQRCAFVIIPPPKESSFFDGLYRFPGPANIIFPQRV